MANAYDLTATGETVNLTRPFVLSFSERPSLPLASVQVYLGLAGWKSFFA